LVFCDPRLVRQVIFNLLSNAVKFTAQGEVRLLATTRHGALRIAVTDTGIGIAAEHLEDIFKSFHQVDNSTQRQFGGTGLGLAISRTLARAMGGDVEVTSEVGKGSTFTLSLPLVDAGVEPAPDSFKEQEEPSLTPASALANRILLIEASPLGRNVMTKAIAADSMPSSAKVIACDGPEAAAAAAGDTVCLIVADIPSAGGWDGMAALLASTAWSGRAVPVLALVQGAIDEAAAAQAAALGISQILSRPMSAAALRASVAALTHVPPDTEDEPGRVAA